MSDSSSKPAVDTPNPEYTAMVQSWALIDALMGGTAAMQAAGETYLPREEMEQVDVYNIRLKNSVLFGRFAAAVSDLKGRPYAEPTQVQNAERLPDQLAGLPESVDDEGRSITAFCEHALKIAILRGMVHLLVDYPSVTASNLAEERSMGLRPMILAIDPANLFAWQYEKALNGEKTLTQIRINETAIESDGGFGFEVKQRIRVIYAGRPGMVWTDPDAGPAPEGAGHWELWEKLKGQDGKEAWSIVQSGPWTAGKITLETVYLEKTGFMTAKCPLEALAEMNLHHWQLYSDHRNNLRFAMAKVLFGKGMSQKEVNQKVVFGVHYKFMCESQNADMKVVGDDGSTVAAGENALKRVEERMDALAMGPLAVQASGNETATGKAINEGKGQCRLQSWVQLLEAGMNKALGYAYEWIGQEKPDDVTVDINNEFETLSLSADDMQFIESARARGDIDHYTYLDCMRLRRMFRWNADLNKIIEACNAEGPAPGMIGREEEQDDDDQDDSE